MKFDADRTDWAADYSPAYSLPDLFNAVMLAKYVEELARVEEMFALSVAESGANIDVAKELWDIAQTMRTVAANVYQLASHDASKTTRNGADHIIHSPN